MAAEVPGAGALDDPPAAGRKRHRTGRRPWRRLVCLGPVPSFGPGRYFAAAIFGFFTCVWVGGIVAGLLIGGHTLSILGWALEWAVVGGWVPLGVWLSLSPTRPESVLMTAYEFRHDPGWSPPLYLLGQQIGRQPMFPKGLVTLPKSEVAFTLAGDA